MVKFYNKFWGMYSRQDCLVILWKYKPPKCNINREEALKLRSLRFNNKMITIVHKSNATILMNAHKHHVKMYKHLTNGGSWQKLEKYPSARHTKEVSMAIKSSNLKEGLKKKNHS